MFAYSLKRSHSMRVPRQLRVGLTLFLLLASVNLSAGQVELAWDANTEPSLAGYRVHYGLSSGNYTASVDVGKQTNYVLYGLEVGQRYYFAVTAYANAGIAESEFSNEVSTIISDDARDTFLESPSEGSFESGIGLIRGWVCNASTVEVEIDGGERMVTASGTPRADTDAVCGNPNTGYGLTVNWNHWEDGEHVLRAFADGIEFANVTFTVTTLGEEFLEDVSGNFVLSDFPESGDQASISWSEAHQNFVVSTLNTASSTLQQGSADIEYFNNSLGAFQESPSEGSSESGIGLIRGWVCNASTVEVEIDGGERLVTSYGSARYDTTEVCGTPFTGYGLTVNWNHWGDGPHVLRAFADGVEFASVMFNVTTLGVEFLNDAPQHDFSLEDFPYSGASTAVRWSKPHQNFVIVGFDD